LNEDLTEVIALSHDLGHPPFGHSGEAALDDALRDHGGFDHNLYGLRRVDELEYRYPDFVGLNLSWELREAFVQHSRRTDLPEMREFFAAGGPLLEAQVVDAADSLAYDSHDTDDALGIGLISLDDLEEVELWCRACEPVRRQHPRLKGDALRTAVIRELIAWQVSDLIHETERRISVSEVDSPGRVRQSNETLVGFGADLLALKTGLERFLQERVYHHHETLRRAEKGKRFLKELFGAFVSQPELLPDRHLRRWTGAPARLQPASGFRRMSLECVVADYLAGMTDRFAQQEYRRLFLPAGDL
jgi:dGTPase